MERTASNIKTLVFLYGFKCIIHVSSLVIPHKYTALFLFSTCFHTFARSKTKIMIKPIVAYGNPVLRKVAVDIDKDYPDFQTVITNL